MTRSTGIVAGSAMLVLLAGCATQPVGPTVAVMPAANKSFDAFQADQSVCTGYASQQVGGQAQVANNQAVGGAILGTALGAGLGAAAGGGAGAAIGAASGAVVGTGLGAGYSGGSNYEIQQRYNIAYAQCMAAKGNKVPMSQAAYNPPTPAYYPGYGYPYAPGYYPGFYGPYGYGYGFGPVVGFGFGGGYWHGRRW
jgi:outer membrane lipoprotein SlyB